MSDTPTPTCPHCGAEATHATHPIDPAFWCMSHTGLQSDYCRERAARQKEEAAHAETKRQLSELRDDLTAKSERIALLTWRYEVQLKAAETAEKGAKDAEQQLTAARAEVEEWKEMAAGLAKLVHRWSSDGDETTEVRESTAFVLQTYRAMKARDQAPTQKGGSCE